MYFYKQLREMFFQSICQRFDGAEGGFGAQDKFDKKPGTDIQDPNLSIEDQAKLKELQELKDELSGVLSSKKFVKEHAENLKNALINVEKLDPSSKEDPEFKELVAKVVRLQKEFKALTEEGQQIDHIVRQKMVEISGEAQGQIDKLKGKVTLRGAKVDATTTGSVEKATNPLDVSPELVTKLNEYIESKEKEAGLEKGTLLNLLKDDIDFTGIADNEEEKKAIEQKLQDPKNFDVEINKAIASLKEKEIKDFTEIDIKNPEKGRQQMNLLIQNDPVGWSNQLKPLTQNKEGSLDDGTLMGKILEFLRTMFGIEKHDQGAFSTYGASIETSRNMIGGSSMYELGSLSKLYESGKKGPVAINGDDNGMPSFGTYQLRQDYLRDFADGLGIEGDHKKIFKNGNESVFAQNWIKKVQEIGPDKFQKMEHDFIKKTHYDKVADNSGFDVGKSSIVVQNIIWSTAVQHGPGTSIIKNAVKKMGNFKPGDQKSEMEFVKTVYALRAVGRESQHDRYKKEGNMAISQLYALGAVEAGKITSVQKEVVRNPDGSVKMTYCARTARLNAAKLGMKVPKVESARALENHFNSKGELSGNPNSAVFQVFSRSKRYPEYGHVATGFTQGGQSYVLDPYLPVVGGKYSHNPIPYQVYKTYINNVRGGMRGVVNL